MRTFIQIFVLSAAIFAIVPASAELYKWVDERGVTNYSNEPPSGAASKLAHVENRVSVYTPDETLMRAVQASRERAIIAVSEPGPQRAVVARISSQPQSGYEQCVQSGRSGCEALNRNYYPAYLPVAAVYPWRGVQPTRFLTPSALAPRADQTRVSRGARH